jgi:imidazolonepropionase-like amidohydrolase
MQRPNGEAQNLSYETPAKLNELGIAFAFTSGYEGYVPKVRVVLMEAAVAVANGLSDADALNGLTLGAAKLLGIEKRTGSLAVGKDADLALFDGDPFEYMSHCTATIIDGKVVWEGKR